MMVGILKTAKTCVSWLGLLVAATLLLSCGGGGKDSPPADNKAGPTTTSAPAVTAPTTVPTTAPTNTSAPIPTALSPQSNAAPTHLNAGIDLLDAEKFEEAIAELDQAIALDPDLTLAYSKRGFAYGQLDQHQKALADFEKAFELEPDSSDNDELYFNLALSYFKTGNYRKSADFWTKTIEAGRKDAPVYLERARSYFNLKQYKEVVADCSQAIELGLDSELADAYNLRGKSNAYLNNFEEAISDLSQAIELDSQLAEAYFNRAVSRTKLNQLDKTSEIIADMAMVLKISEDPDMRRQAQTLLENAYKNLPDPALRQQAAVALGLQTGASAGSTGDNFETYVHTINCLLYSKTLKLPTFSVLYPKGFVITTCKQNPQNYVIFELNPDRAKQDSDFALVFGSFSLEGTSGNLESIYPKAAEDLLNRFGPQIAAPFNAQLISDETITVKPHKVPLSRRDYVGKRPDQEALLIRLMLIPNFDLGEGLFFLSLKKVADPQKEFAEFDALTQKIIASINFAPAGAAAAPTSGGADTPEAALQAVFDAAKSGDFSRLSSLCDPLGKNDADTATICAITAQHARKDSFVEFFAKGKISGKTVIKDDQAEVPFLFGPLTDQKETMVLILRDGRWYLSAF